MGSVMNDRHHRLVMLLNPEGEIVARRFIRLGIITGQKKEKRKALYFLKKLIPKEQLDFIERSLQLVAYRYAQKFNWPLYQKNYLLERANSETRISLGAAYPGSPLRYSDASYLSYGYSDIEKKVSVFGCEEIKREDLRDI